MKLENMGQLAVVFPILHVLVSAIYLTGYAAGFGGGVGSLFSAGDIFGVNLTELLWVYSVGLLLPLLMASHEFLPGYKTAADHAKADGSPEALQNLARKRRQLSRILAWVIPSLVAFYVCRIALAATYDEQIPYVELNLFAASVIPLAWLMYAQKLETSFAFDRLISILIGLIGAALIIGLTEGQRDRRYGIEKFQDIRMSCGQFIVLRNASDLFLAADKSGRRVVIDRECKAVLFLPARRKFSDKSWVDLTADLLR